MVNVKLRIIPQFTCVLNPEGRSVRITGRQWSITRSAYGIVGVCVWVTCYIAELFKYPRLLIVSLFTCPLCSTNACIFAYLDTCHYIHGNVLLPSHWKCGRLLFWSPCICMHACYSKSIKPNRMTFGGMVGYYPGTTLLDCGIDRVRGQGQGHEKVKSYFYHFYPIGMQLMPKCS